MTFSFLKIIIIIITKNGYCPTELNFNFKSKDIILIVLHTLILIYLYGSGNNFVGLLLMSFKYW